MFNNSFYEEARKKVIGEGLRFAHTQHNGDLFVRLSSDNTLFRKVIDLNGAIRTYKPREATGREIQLYALT